MSGFLALLNTDRRPCDPDLLRRLAGRLSFRGPDGGGLALRGHVGLASALFKATRESEHESQPLSFDGSTWIVADARIDDRERLLGELAVAGRDVARHAPDVELILHSYHAWGADCVRYLLGDFAFVVWDERDESLFASRDHFGVKQLYYADLPGVLLLSNTLSCLRGHPAVSPELNEHAIGDFLLFGLNQSAATTAFRDVQRLPGAHTLSRRDGRTSVARYWSLPEYVEPLRDSSQEILDRFRTLMRQAVADRMRSPSVAISLSGGVDSSTVAAAAADVRDAGASQVELHAWMLGLQGLLPRDEEVRYASLTAQALALQPHVFDASDYRLYATDDDGTYWPQPGPTNYAYYRPSLDFARGMARTAPVALTGEGGDAVFGGSQLYFLRGLRSRRCLRVLGQTMAYLVTQREFPPLGIRSRWLTWLRGTPRPAKLPAWINPDFARRTDLEGRWRDFDLPPHPPARVLRPEAYVDLSDFWQTYLDQCDADCLGFPLEYRHPLLDLRLVEFLLQVPPIPWFGAKTLPRRAWRERVPSKVKRRNKVPLAGDYLQAALSRGDDMPEQELDLSGVGRFISLNQHTALTATVSLSQDDGWLATQPLNLAIWIASLHLCPREGNTGHVRPIHS